MFSTQLEDITNLPPNLSPQGFSIRSAKLKELVDQLATTHKKMELSGTTNKDFSLELANSVFTTPNLEYFVQVYFQRAQPYYPILHPPTFDIENVASTLLLATFLMGAIFSPPIDDAISARKFIATAEEFIFTDASMREISEATSEQEEETHAIQVMQAALLIVAIHNNLNDPVARRRIHNQRLPALASAVRLSGVLSAKHSFSSHDDPTCSFDKFLKQELRIRLALLPTVRLGGSFTKLKSRLAHWVQLSSTFVTCFFNTQPHIGVSEMIGDLPCRREVFAASDEHAYLRALNSTNPRSKTASLAVLTEQFLQVSSPAQPHDELLSFLTSEHLFLVLGGKS
jgi:hypothetical protein